jgi:Yip1 domain
MKCARCAHALEDGALYCGQCGAIVGAVYAPPAAPAQFEPAAPAPAEIAPSAPVPPADIVASPPMAPSVASVLLSAAPATGIVARIIRILVTPRTEWPVIANETTSRRAIYLRYVAPLAAIGAIALFIGQVFVGSVIPLIGMVRASVAAGIVAAICTFALALLSVFALAKFIDRLAPMFGGQSDPLRALKASAYSYTPAWIAGVLQLIPAWSIFTLLASFYGLYLLYVGLPVLMRCGNDKAGPYLAVVAAMTIALLVLLGAITASVAGFGPGMFS